VERTHNAGDEILVNSASGDMLWDANIVALSKRDEGSSVSGYRVHYNGWSSRFDQWVSPDRVVDLNDDNIQKQVRTRSDVFVFLHLFQNCILFLTISFVITRAAATNSSTGSGGGGLTSLLTRTYSCIISQRP
jgi:hypothetical protein